MEVATRLDQCITSETVYLCSANMLNYPTHSAPPTHTTLPSSLHKHTPYTLPVAGLHSLHHLLLRQPLELLIAILISTDIRLSRHNPPLHKENLLTILLLLEGRDGGGGGDKGVGGDGVEAGGGVVTGVVAYGVVADDPGVHIYAEGLDEDAFGCLWSWEVSKRVCVPHVDVKLT